MKEVYKAALNNDLAFIEDYVKTNPKQIDVGCDGITFDDILEAERQNANKQELETSPLVALMTPLVKPLLKAIVYSILVYTPIPDLAKKQRELYYEKIKTFLKTQNYFKGWTPIQFAAAGDSLEVAMFLIKNKANTNNTFLQIAKELEHENFYKACETILAVSKLTQDRDTAISNQHVLEGNQKRLEDQVKQLSAFRAALISDVDVLKKENTDIKSEKRDLTQKIAKLKLERAQLEKKHGEESSKLKSEYDILNDKIALLEKAIAELDIEQEDPEPTRAFNP